MVEDLPEGADTEGLGKFVFKVEFNGKDTDMGRLFFDQEMDLNEIMAGTAQYIRKIADSIDFSAQAHAEIDTLLTGEFE